MYNHFKMLCCLKIRGKTERRKEKRERGERENLSDHLNWGYCNKVKEFWNNIHKPVSNPILTNLQQIT